MRRLVIILCALTLCAPTAFAKGKGGHRSNYCATCPRDSHGRIKRSPEARQSFKKSNPCPSTGKSSGACPGYTIDHVKPLKRGGADVPSNMQSQTEDAAKAKGRVE